MSGDGPADPIETQDIPARLRRHFGRGADGAIILGPEGDHPKTGPLKAAQYLRMSTDHQRYSLGNQRAFIERFALDRGIEIVATYEDEGRSGVTVDGRPGLQSLLSDVLSGSAPFSAILVLDVSRWGRFQDPDEAAHYEYLCREAGISVVYCAEPFANDSFGSVIKQLKRVMAGEYSRDLSVKVRAGRRAKAARGRALGGIPIYGFRRRIINADGSLGAVLEDGQRKSRLDQEVRYVWGPPHELDVVRRIFDLFVSEARSQAGIARCLNGKGVTWRDGTPWTPDRVQKMLRRELVVGFQAYGKSRLELGQRTHYVDRSQWTYVRVLDPVVDVDTFVAAQERMGALKRGRGKTEEEMVRELRQLLASGKPTLQAISKADNMLSPAAYRSRFGSMAAAYERVGYQYSGFRRGLNPDGTPFDRGQIIAALQALYARHGRISLRLIKSAGPQMPGDARIRQVFGSIPEAYEAAGLAWGRWPGPEPFPADADPSPTVKVAD
ncbi:recombinase family protein [Brevundimonas sp.]|uniref:recombinase family protein n=1 Tax=Brevundimonas sp. TaxID=1871086 RepID=UPI0039E2B2E6